MMHVETVASDVKVGDRLVVQSGDALEVVAIEQDADGLWFTLRLSPTETCGAARVPTSRVKVVRGPVQ